MPKSKPIGVRFDIQFLEAVKEEQNLTSTQQVVDFLMEHYLKRKKKEKPKVTPIDPAAYDRRKSKLGF